MLKWIVIFACIGTSAFSQDLVLGTVIDGETNEPVPFASVAIEGQAKGTSTNLYGQFSLSIDKPVNLLISCIGYETIKISSADANGIIKLKAGITRLNTVYITDKPLNARRIVRKAFGSIRDNFNTKPFFQKFFYRHYCKDGDSYGRLVEASVDLWKNGGYRSTQSSAGQNDEIRIVQLRRSLDNTRGAEGHESVAIDDILQTDIVGYQAPTPVEHLSLFDNVSHLKVNMQDYEFTCDGITIHDGQEVYEVSYAFKRDSALTRAGNYMHYPNATGKLFITTSDFAFVKTEVVRSFSGSHIQQNVYYRKFADAYYPYHYIMTGLNKAPAWGDHEYHIELMSVDVDTSPTAKFTGKLPHEGELLKIPYDSMFWAKSTVLRTTPLEDEIIKDLGGGKSLSEQFRIYRQYQQCVHDGGMDAEQKISWLRDYFKGKYAIYFVFWSENFKSYIVELEMAKRLYPEYRNQVKFVFVSLDDDNPRWEQTVEQFNFFSDGIINYRVGSRSKFAKMMHVSETPGFVLIGKYGEIIEKEIKRPNDPGVHDQLRSSVSGNYNMHE